MLKELHNNGIKSMEQTPENYKKLFADIAKLHTQWSKKMVYSMVKALSKHKDLWVGGKGR